MQREVRSATKADLPTGWTPPKFTLTEEEKNDLIDALSVVASDGAYQAIQQLLDMGWSTLNVNVATQANADAVAYAHVMGADLITGIDQTTQNDIADLVADAIDEGWSNDELADALADDYTFSDDRAETIARTETAYADVAGNISTYRQAGVEKKRWLLGPNSCDICAENADDGDIDFDDVFSSGAYAPPEHPNCTCDILPVLPDDDNTT